MSAISATRTTLGDSGLSRIWLFSTFLIACCALTNSALSATFVVDDLGDSPDINPGDGVCRGGLGFDCTLRAAIMETNTLTGDDIVELPGGTIMLTVEGTDEDAAATGDLDILDSLTIRSDGLRTTIDGNGIDRVFDLLAGSGANLSGVIIQGGVAPFGGGVRSLAAQQLLISDSVIEDNRANEGGGIFSRTETIVRSSTIRNNTSIFEPFNSDGSAIRIESGQLQLDSVAIYDNEGSDGDRAEAIWAAGATIEIVNSTISGNQQASGSHDSYALSAFSTDVVLRNVTIVDHNIGLSVRGASSLSMRNSVIAYNLLDCDYNNVSDDIDGYNLDSDDSCGLAPGVGNLPGTDPQLGSLADGPVGKSHFPLAGSPVIDAGAPNTATGLDACLADDQHGAPRLDGNGLPAPSVCDLGAVEFVEDTIFLDGFES